MEKSLAIERLTEREREALRGWLSHKTAKEIALDLGISHHAVEKRLKMARIKLDVGSSLEAARLLAQAEAAPEGVIGEYGRAVPASPDLSPATLQRASWRHPAVISGGIAMVIASLVTLALVAAPQPDQASAGSEPAGARKTELEQSTRRAFNRLDTDGSGFLEGAESPLRAMILLAPGDRVDPSGRFVVTGELPPDAAPPAERLAQFYREADRDGDGRVSYLEYHHWALAGLAEAGLAHLVSLKPQD